jgi:16S rRNA processing protein RimM
LALPDGEYYFADLIGYKVVERESRKLAGTVTGWQETGGPVLLELDGGRVLVPFVKAILEEIDLEAREIRATFPDGLLDLNA